MMGVLDNTLALAGHVVNLIYYNYEKILVVWHVTSAPAFAVNMCCFGSFIQEGKVESS